VAAGAAVVAVERGDRVEEEEAADVGELRVEAAAERASSVDATRPVNPCSAR
jgi:hypothetical protein